MKKRAVLLALAVCILLSVMPSASAAVSTSEVWNGTDGGSFFSGSGTKSYPYTIKTAEQLAYFANQVNSGNTYSGKYIKLVSNIVLNDSGRPENWEEVPPKNTWTPIGSEEAPFAGNFDGGGFFVSGIYIDSQMTNAGLFGFVKGATVKDVSVVNSYISGGSYVGGIAGQLSGGVISNCSSIAIVSGTTYVGGIVGRVYSQSTAGEATVTLCRNDGDVSGSNHVGGIVGLNYAYLTGGVSTVTMCVNTAEVTGAGHNVGGIAGRNMANPAGTSASSTAALTDCINMGVVNGLGYVGGITGNNGASAMSNAVVMRCVNSGSVSEGSFSASIVGQNFAGASGYSRVMNCTYLKGSAQSSVMNGSGGGSESVISVIECSEQQMKSESAYAGFDFEYVWTFSRPESEGLAWPRDAAVIPDLSALEVRNWNSGFSDIVYGSWYYDAVRFVYEHKIFDGRTSTSFAPDEIMTREELVEVMHRFAKSPKYDYGGTFSDVKSDSNVADAIAWAVDCGIVYGNGDGTFDPKGTVTRQQAVVVLYRYAQYLGKPADETADISVFADSGDAENWAMTELCWAVGAGLVIGNDDNTIVPNMPCTRAHVSLLIKRFAEYYGIYS